MNHAGIMEEGRGGRGEGGKEGWEGGGGGRRRGGGGEEGRGGVFA